MHARPVLLEALATRDFDALIVGGGITGAGIARDAAMRGLAVALVEKDDFGAGTSSRSSRLIHGGVRYLEHGHLHLVFEASAERRRLLRIAPHLVHPVAFTWPVYEGQRLPLWKLRAGLTLYDLLSLFRNVARHHRLSAREVIGNEPALRTAGLRGGVRYFDAATNDARLTLANVLDAARLGAVAVNHVAFAGAGRRGSDGFIVSGAEDALSGERMRIRAKTLVNATGPWSDVVRRLAGGAPEDASHVQGSKGAHISVPRDRLRNRDAVTLLHPADGRVMFALPAGAHAIVGTTDTFTNASPDDVRASEADVAYLLAAANALFPDARLVRGDVVAAWAGIRPLMPSRGSSVAASREHAITRAGGTVTITGGKLTTYRVMAAQAADAIEESSGRPHRRAPTGARQLPAAPPVAAGVPLVNGLPWLTGDLTRGVRDEMAQTLGDLLIRRTQVAFETRDNGRAAARLAAGIAAPLLGWDEARRARELERYDAEVTRMFSVDP